MLEKLLYILSGIDGSLASWSHELTEKRRQAKLAELMEGVDERLADDQEGLQLLTAYAELRAQYREFLPLLRLGITIEASPWVEAGGNQVESIFHHLSHEIRSPQYPEPIREDLIQLADQIDLLIPIP